MRILFLSQGRRIEDQPDFDAALRKAQCCGERVELVNIPYIEQVEKSGCVRFYEEVLRVNREFHPDLVFFQFFHASGLVDPRSCVKALQSAGNHPLVFGSLGDAFNTGSLKWFGRPMAKSLLWLASAADAFFTTAMGETAEELLRTGARNVLFLPHAFNQSHFSLAKEDACVEKKDDVVVVGSRAGIFVPHMLTGITRGVTRMRTVSILTKHFGKRLALYGRGWKSVSSRGVVPYDQQLEVMKAGRVCVEFPAQINDRYYASDRPFFIAGSGTPLVMQLIPGFDRIFRSDEHAYYVHTISELPEVCDRVLHLPQKLLEERRKSTLKLIAERHLIANRMDTMLSVYEAIRAHRAGTMQREEAMRHLRLWHFLPEVDLEREYPYAVRNWIG